jgi:hypothetical protein
MNNVPINMVSAIPAEGWAAVYLDPEHDDPQAEVPRLIHMPLAAWAHVDDPAQPIVGMVVGTGPDESGGVGPCDAEWLVGYLHRSQGIEVLSRRLLARRGILTDQSPALPGWKDGRSRRSCRPPAGRPSTSTGTGHTAPPDAGPAPPAAGVLGPPDRSARAPGGLGGGRRSRLRARGPRRRGCPRRISA